jgi:mannose-1-phosphate guanylyltransferase
VNIYGIIIAGGQGKRLWPLSRLLRPKPVLAITKEQSLIKQTLQRLNTIVETGNLIVVTNEEVFAPIYESIKEVPLENVLAEPVGRNTAAAIGLACIHIMERCGDAIAIVTPADHYIGDDNQFADLLKKAVDVCRKTDTVVVFGVRPESPSTNYGYIAKGEKSEDNDVFKVAKFTEKPPQKTAEQFVAEGYLWNAGIFVFRISSLLNAIKQHMPELSSALEKIKKTLKGPYERKTIKEEYSKLGDVSIDKGIIEKLDTVSVIEMNIPWADLGSFEQIANIMMTKDEQGNQRMGKGIDVDSTNNIIVGEDNFVVTANVHDLIIIASDGRILVTSKGSDEVIARVVNTLHARGLKEHI